MNKEIENSINDLKEYIFNDRLVKKYIKLKEIIANSDFLYDISCELKTLKKCGMSEENKKRFDELSLIYNNEPLIKEFNEVSDELYSYLDEIKRGIII